MRRTTTLALAGIAALVVVVGGPAAVASYGHAREVAHKFGEEGGIADWLPLTTDGLLFAALAVITIQSWRGERAGRKVWGAFWVGTVATLGANLAAADLAAATGPGDALGRALVALWPPVAFAVTLELAITLVGFVRTAVQSADDEQAPAVEVDRSGFGLVQTYAVEPSVRTEQVEQSGTESADESGTESAADEVRTDEIPAPTVVFRQPRPRSASDVRWTEQDEAIRIDLQARFDDTRVRPTLAEVRTGYGMGYARANKILDRLVEPVPAEGSGE